jgi:hypothetical protein
VVARVSAGLGGLASWGRATHGVRWRGSASDDGGGRYSSPHLPLSSTLHLPHSSLANLELARTTMASGSLEAAGPSRVTAGPDLATAGLDPVTTGPDSAMAGPDPVAGSLELDATAWT